MKIVSLMTNALLGLLQASRIPHTLAQNPSPKLGINIWPTFHWKPNSSPILRKIKTIIAFASKYRSCPSKWNWLSIRWEYLWKIKILLNPFSAKNLIDLSQISLKLSKKCLRTKRVCRKNLFERRRKTKFVRKNFKTVWNYRKKSQSSKFEKVKWNKIPLKQNTGNVCYKTAR